ncbi:MAG TPA: urate hydroxylase PuuD [Roseiarcus sp.]|jgi:uncharacterized membrane protein|nr:urate hydroxylase PuuD [Roseiarcus sp.]
MEALGTFGWEWGAALLRWLHVIAAIAWIGGSFFFMHLDASLRKKAGDDPAIAGTSWQVHGGGFYQMNKYVLAPAVLPEHLIWHKWQSYWTWISGFALLCWVYYGQSSLYLIDPAVMALAPWQAAAIGIVGLALGWIVYDFLCRSPLAENEPLLALVGFGYVVATSFVFTLFFSGRGALIHTGALMATIMTANVFFIIMPNQRKSVAALIAGEKPDPKWVKSSKVRSTHNNYITLPVVFLMLSSHVPSTFSNPRVIPAIVTCVIVAGAMVRYFYNVWHLDHDRAPWWAWAAAAVAILGAFGFAATASPYMRTFLGLADLSAATARADEPKAPQEVVDIIQLRCMMCHAAQPMEEIGEAPKGILLDTPEHIARFAPAIREFAVLTHAMPPNNFSQMTDDERRTLGRWLGLETAQN